MACGRDHDRGTLLASVPFAILLLPLVGLGSALIGAAAFCLGGLWLSPDLDTLSRPLRRWGPLQLIWWPYRCLIPHRSLLSHGLFIGMGLRLAWLLTCALLTWLLISPLSAVIPGLILPDPGQILRGIIRTLERHPESALAGLLGLEASVWLHLILDGDPLPAEWSRRRRRRQ